MRKFPLAARGYLWLLLLLLGSASPTWGLDPFLQKDQARIIDAATINGTGEVCSPAQAVWRRQYLSLQWIATSSSGTANVRIYVTGSINETDFVTPSGVSDITPGDTTEAWNIVGIYLPFVWHLRVCVAGKAGNPADTVATVWLALQ